MEERIWGTARCEMTSRASLTVTAGRPAIASAISRAVVSRSVAGHDPAHHTVRVRLVDAHHPAGQDEIAHQAMARHFVQHADAAGVGDDAVGDFRQPEARTFGGDPDVTQQSPLERSAHDPALAGHDDGASSSHSC